MRAYIEKSMIIYGIKNCDTIKKTINWLKENNKEFTFHDYKKEGIGKEKLKAWTQQVSWEDLLNKRGTTWRKLSPEEQAKITNTEAAIELMAENTSIIKRPVIEKDGKIVAVGFDKERMSKL